MRFNDSDGLSVLLLVLYRIPDPDATKPDDWVEEEMIVDESAEKPEGWLDDEPQEVDDAGLWLSVAAALFFIGVI